MGAVALAVLGVVTAAGTAAAEPANNACPAGYQTFTVAQAQAEGYLTSPLIVDTAGNSDGVVCRRGGCGTPADRPDPLSEATLRGHRSTFERLIRRFRNNRIRALLCAGRPNWPLLDQLTPP